MRSLLIANRGEIACRIIHSAKKMGIETIAVYSEVDQNSLWVELADKAVCLGGPAAQDSYLKGDLIIQKALELGADAIHPGYGFLSENADFARAVVAAGLIFVGPPASAIDAMGSKSAAKELMSHAHVPLVPGYHGENQDTELLHQEADRMGYPVLIKASAGGGGKGMRIVQSSDQFVDALESCQREALKSFSDDKVLIEKYLPHARHVEIQVFADKHKNAVYLFERDCSVQRRHQKIIEEAPAPNLDAQTRVQMGEAAVRAALAVNYEGAGTIEFIFDLNSNQFYFMEMNTRLQVEHPVTEMITQTDLVQWQLNVAMGKALPKTQAELHVHGHAFEVRIYAEDPQKDFLPATGTIEHLIEPQTSEWLRIDTGIRAKDSISPFYDPMIAKLIVWGQDRDEALQRLNYALNRYQITGLSTNLAFLSQLSQHPEFKQANVHTGFIEQHHSDLLSIQRSASTQALALIAAAYLLERAPLNEELSAFRLNHRFSTALVLDLDDEHILANIDVLDNGAMQVEIHQQRFMLNVHLNQTVLSGSLDDQSVQAVWLSDRGLRVLQWNEQTIRVGQHDPLEPQIEHSDVETHLRAPMPGRVIAHLVQVGDAVVKGQALMVLEAMKMEHTIHAPTDGIVGQIFFALSEQVQDSDELLEIIKPEI